MAGACLLALSVASCGGSSGGSSTESNVNAGGKTIPKTTTQESKQSTTLTMANGAPKVVQFKAPREFWCLRAHPAQAQVTLGWSVPSATNAAILLDGTRVHSGIRRALPFSVLGGTPSGIGTTVVFQCRPDQRHRITVRWGAHGSPTAERTVTITKSTRQ
jgi:hypothetical protein